MRLFVDLDGVLADFDTHYNNIFGVLPSSWRTKEFKNGDVDWDAVREYKNFYAGIPPMSDMHELWRFIAPYKPIVLTGVPSSVPEASDNKRGWVAKNLGKHVEVRCCLSRNKNLHAEPGDVLIDDWEKYMDKWVAVGGIWVTHTSAKSTIEKLKPILESSNRGERL